MHVYFSFLVKIFIAGIILVIIGELAARIFSGAPRKEKLPLHKVQPDSVHGYLPLPFDDHYSFDVKVKLDSLGLRTGTGKSSGSGGKIRVAIVGESLVYGVGLADSQLISRRLEDELSAMMPDSDIQVINVGIRGYDIRQQYLYWQKYMNRIDADYCIVVATVYAMLLRNINQYYRNYMEYEWYYLDTGNQLKSNQQMRWSVNQVIRSSALISSVYDIYKNYQQRKGLLGRLFTYDKQKPADELAGQFLATARDFQKLNNQANVSFCLVMVPHKAQFSLPYTSDCFPAYLIRDLEKEGIATVEVTEVLMSQYQDNTDMFIPYTAHYNENAQRIIASQLTGYLMQELSPKNSPQ